MAKLPFFPFYVNDFLGSRTVACLTLEQIGAYTLLLAHAWGDDDCLLPDDIEELMSLCQNKLSSREALAKLIEKAFVRQAEPKPGLFNAKLRAVKIAYLEHSRTMSEAGKKGAEKKKLLKLQEKEAKAKLKPSSSQAQAKDKLSLASALTLSSASALSDSPALKSKDICPESLRLSGLLADLILQHTPDYRGLNNGQRDKTVHRWSIDIDRMIRIDKRDPSVIEQIIIFAQKDLFWYKNILSGETLRKQYDKLGMNMRQSDRNKNDKHSGIDAWLQETYYAKQ